MHFLLWLFLVRKRVSDVNGDDFCKQKFKSVYKTMPLKHFNPCGLRNKFDLSSSSISTQFKILHRKNLNSHSFLLHCYTHFFRDCLLMSWGNRTPKKKCLEKSYSSVERHLNISLIQSRMSWKEHMSQHILVWLNV